MAQRPRFDCPTVGSNSENRSTFFALFNVFGDNIAVLSQIPCDSEENQLIQFFNKFGEIQNLWLEEPNGKEDRQALIILQSSKSFENMVNGIENDFPESIVERLNVFCGLALEEQNTEEIASDKFIEKLVEFTNSQNNDIKSYALELLLILAENSESEMKIIVILICVQSNLQ
ncbi:MAG: hypothetical protein EZS28_017557 [Streblomastix strix]|uniref:Uncharacterized protein n=1 Tax=Streblomastix strix TaxID=222440 RepID=A0A5J4VWJ8_9EUKA|nr:MAG: hypothetical protein EZS28_017557 [Streblomastix strix]